MGMIMIAVFLLFSVGYLHAESDCTWIGSCENGAGRITQWKNEVYTREKCLQKCIEEESNRGIICRYYGINSKNYCKTYDDTCTKTYQGVDGVTSSQCMYDREARKDATEGLFEDAMMKAITALVEEVSTGF